MIFVDKRIAVGTSTDALPENEGLLIDANVSGVLNVALDLDTPGVFVCEGYSCGLDCRSGQ